MYSAASGCPSSEATRRTDGYWPWKALLLAGPRAAIHGYRVQGARPPVHQECLRDEPGEPCAGYQESPPQCLHAAHHGPPVLMSRGGSMTASRDASQPPPSALMSRTLAVICCKRMFMAVRWFV